MLWGILVSDLDYGGVELVFGWGTLRCVWGWFIDVLLLCLGRLLLLGYFNGWLFFLLGFARTVSVGLYALIARLLRLGSFVDGLVVSEALFV